MALHRPLSLRSLDSSLLLFGRPSLAAPGHRGLRPDRPLPATRLLHPVGTLPQHGGLQPLIRLLLRQKSANLLLHLPVAEEQLLPEARKPLSGVRDMPVGARLLLYNWDHLHLSPWHRHTLEIGLRWHWHQLPPLTNQPKFIRLPPDSMKQDILLAEIKALVDKRALIPADPSIPGFYSHLFLVPKKTGGFRPVIDLKALNKFVICRTFRMETPVSIRSQLQPHEWTTSIDLADAYLHVPVDPSFQPYLRIAIKDQVWQFRAMPFGLNIAPRTFTHLLAPVAAALRAQGIKIHRYLDDWLIRATSYQEANRHTSLVIQMLTDLGFLIRLEKSDLTPRRDFVFLGVNFNTLSHTVAPPPDKVQGVVQLVQQVISLPRIRLRLLLRVIGVLNHVADYVALGRLHVRPIQFYLLSFNLDLRSDLEALIPVRPSLRVALLPWTDATWLSARVPLRNPDPHLTLATDASLVGWGAHTGNRLLSGRWTSQERRLHISVLELRAVYRALLDLQQIVQGQSVRIMTDSISAAAYIRRQGGTRSLTLYQEARRLLLWCRDHQVTLTPHFLPGHLNVLADLQSRPHQVLSTEWTLHHSVFARLLTHFPAVEIDLFATRLNHRLPRFVSPFPDPQAVDSDALTMSWSGLQAYAFPPFAILPEVLRKVATSNMTCILIAPWWPTQAWFPEALRLLTGPPVQLPPYRRLLSQPHRPLYHSNPGWLNLHAWPLSSSASDRLDFQSELHHLRPATYDQAPGAYTSRIGAPSATGVGPATWIPCIPL